MEEMYVVKGKVVAKGSNRPIENVIVQAYWIDLEELKGDKANWASGSRHDDALARAGSDATDSAGSFVIEVNPENAPNQHQYIALEAWPPDDEGHKGTIKALYRSPAPRSFHGEAFFVIRIPDERLVAFDLMPRLLTRKEALEKLDDEQSEVAEWFEEDRKKRNKELAARQERAKKAFANFKPSTLSRSIRGSKNYSSSQASLSRKLKAIRGDALQRIADNKITKQRRINLSERAKRELGLENDKTVKLPFREAAHVLRWGQVSVEDTVKKSLSRLDDRNEKEQELIRQLYERLIQEFGA